MRKAKEKWIEEQCQGIEENLQEKNQPQESLSACERTDKLKTRENYYHPGQSMVLDVSPPTNNDSYPILHGEVEAAEIYMLLIICNKIW